MNVEETTTGRARSTVSNSEFLSELLRAAAKGTTVWVCGFIGNPNGADAQWGGSPYDAARMASVVDGWARHNTFFSVAAVKRLDDGRFHRTKLAFARLLVLVADDVLLEDLQGSVSYVLQTSPGKCQVGILLDATDPDCENAELVGALMRAMAGKSLVQLDKAGNNLVRYVRAPLGQNQKPRESGHFDHRLTTWAPSVRMSLEDAASVFGIDLDEVRAELAAAPMDAGGQRALGEVEFQDEKIRRLTGSILRGEELHDSTRDLAASLVASGAHGGTVTTMLQALLESSHAQRARPQEWRDRMRDIGRLVRDAEKKFRRAAPSGVNVTIDLATGEVVASPKKPLFVRVGVLIANPRAAVWIAKGILEANAVSIVWGEPGLGKTHVVLSIAAAVVVGAPWFDRPTKKGPVFVIAGEGHNGMARRFAAIQKEHGYDLANAPLFISERAGQFGDPASAMEFAEEIERMVADSGEQPVLIVIDTLSRNLGDGDENSSKDIMAFFSNIDQHIRTRWGCHVAVVHHSPHGQERARGSTAIRGVVDQEFGVVGVQGSGMLTLKCTKMKDGDPPAPIDFKIKRIELGEDENGEELDGATIVLNQDRYDIEMGKSTNGSKITARDVLRLFVRNGGTFPGYPVVQQELGIKQQKTASRYLERMAAVQMVERAGGKSWTLTKECHDDLSRAGVFSPGIEW